MSPATKKSIAKSGADGRPISGESLINFNYQGRRNAIFTQYICFGKRKKWIQQKTATSF